MISESYSYDLFRHMGFKFEKLKVWNYAIALSTEIHQMTRSWPKEELYNLTRQINRAADSIALNIAEGSTGNTNPEFKRFCTIANRSAIEVVCCLHLARERKLLVQEEFDLYYNKLTIIIKMIQSLKRALN